MYANSSHSIKYLSGLLLCSWLGFLAGPVHADTASRDSILSLPSQAPFSGGPYLLGNWGGARTKLEQEGVKFNLSLVNEAAYNVSGGDRHTGRNAGQVALGVNLNLDKLIGWRGASFQATMTDRYGRNLVQDAQLGVNQQVQEIYGRGQTWLLTQFSLQQLFFDGKLSVRVGRLPIGNSFSYGDCYFQNLSLCGSQPGNLVGSYWYNSPISVWAIRTQVKTSDNTYVQLGVYQNNPTYASSHWERHSGWRLGNPGGTHGVLIPLEFGWSPQVKALGGLYGLYRFGLWYNTGGNDDLYLDDARRPLAAAPDNTKALHRDSSYGGYVSMKQQITGTVDGQGTTVFMNIAMADRRTSRTDRQLAMGAQYKGIFGRSNDFVGMGIAFTHSSGYYADYARLYNQLHAGRRLLVSNGYEKSLEVNYGWSPLPSVSIRPNIQYVIDPNGAKQNKNVFVFGLQSIVNF